MNKVWLSGCVVQCTPVRNGERRILLVTQDADNRRVLLKSTLRFPFAVGDAVECVGTLIEEPIEIDAQRLVAPDGREIARNVVRIEAVSRLNWSRSAPRPAALADAPPDTVEPPPEASSTCIETTLSEEDRDATSPQRPWE